MTGRWRQARDGWSCCTSVRECETCPLTPLWRGCQMKQDNAAGGSTQAAPAHVVVVTKGDADALSSRVTAFQAVSEWAQAKGVPCIAACPTLTARTSARFSVAGVVAVSVWCTPRQRVPPLPPSAVVRHRHTDQKSSPRCRGLACCCCWFRMWRVSWTRLQLRRWRAHLPPRQPHPWVGPSRLAQPAQAPPASACWLAKLVAVGRGDVASCIGPRITRMMAASSKRRGGTPGTSNIT